MFVSATVPLLILLLANLLIFTKDRYVFITLFSWIILAVVGITEMASWLQGNTRWLMIAVFFMLFAYALNDVLLYYQANYGDRLPWKSAFSSVDEQIQEQDIIVAFGPNSTRTMPASQSVLMKMWM